MKGTTIGKQLRQKEVERLYAGGKRSARTIHLALKDEFSVAVTTIEKDITAIRRKWVKESRNASDPEENRAEYLAVNDTLFEEAIAGRDLSTARKIWNDSAAIRGVDFVSPIMRINERSLKDIPIDEIQAEINALDVLLAGSEDRDN